METGEVMLVSSPLPKKPIPMQVTVQRLSPVVVQFDIEIESERVRSEVEKAYSNVAKNAKVRGFRPGKAPRRVLSHVYGPRIAKDVADLLVEETYPKAVSEQKLQPVSNPAIERKALVEDQPFSYTVRVEVLPTIESVKYEGLAAKRVKNAVTDENVKAEIDRLREAHATLEEPKAARAAQKNDMATIDFEVKVEGEVIEDAGASDFQVPVGRGQLLAAIEAAIEGLSLGESKEVEIAMPSNHPHKRLKGKTALFKVTLKALKERVLPAADDEFAKDVGDFETLAALEKNIREQLEKQAEEASENALAEGLVLELVKANPIPVPPSLVERQMQITEQEIITRARQQGGQVSQIGDELREKVRADSEVKVAAGLLMAEVAKKESIQIGNAEIDKGLEELAAQSGKNVAKLRAEYREPQKREMLIGMILENKVLDIIQAKAKIEEG
ncbi:MAG TPA: trigger factor [Polyangiaceae bacterium]